MTLIRNRQCMECREVFQTDIAKARPDVFCSDKCRENSTKHGERRAHFASMFLAAYCGNPYLTEQLQKAKDQDGVADALVEDAIGLADRLSAALEQRELK